MRRYIRIPEDVPAIDPNTDQPFKTADGEGVAKLSFAMYIRALTSRAHYMTGDHAGVAELRVKLTAPVGTVAEIDDEIEAYNTLIEISKDPRDKVFAEERFLMCMLSFAPYARALWNMSTEKPTDN